MNYNFANKHIICLFTHVFAYIKFERHNKIVSWCGIRTVGIRTFHFAKFCNLGRLVFFNFFVNFAQSCYSRKQD